MHLFANFRIIVPVVFEILIANDWKDLIVDSSARIFKNAVETTKNA